MQEQASNSLNGSPDATSRRRKPLNPVDILLRRIVLIILAGSALGALLSPAFMLVGRRVYTAAGILAIDPGKEPTLTGRERETVPGNVGDYMRTLLNRLTAGDVLLEALRAVPPDEWPSGLDPNRPPEANVGRLFKSIKAKEVSRTYLMSVEISGESARGLDKMLNAVLDAFIAKLRHEIEDRNLSRLKYLREERDKLLQRIQEEREHMLSLAAGRSTRAFLHESYAVHLSQVEQIQRLYWEAEARRAERASELLRAERDRRQIRTLSLQPYADERVMDNFGINRIEQWTYEQLQQLRSSIDGLTTNNPDRNYVEMRMDAMNDYLARYKADVQASTIRILNEKREYDLNAAVIAASNAWLAAEEAAQELRAHWRRAQEEAADTSEAIFQATDIAYTINQLRDRLAAINNRIDDVEMESKAPLRISIDRYAAPPTRPTKNTTGQMAAIGFVFGFAAAFAIVLVFEILDDRVRGPAEVRAATGAPPTCVLPFCKDKPLEQQLLDHPNDEAGQALRALALRIHRARQRHQTRVVACCPIGAESGNTAVALSVAHALARLSPRVLLLALGPRGLDQRAGVALPAAGAEALTHPEKLNDGIATDPTRGISLAQVIALPEEWPAKWRLADLIAHLRNRFDFVILDVRAIHADDLAAAALEYADAALLVIREDADLYSHLRAALDAVAAARVALVGTVLNGSRSTRARVLYDQIQRTVRYVSLLHRRASAHWQRAALRWIPKTGQK